jgi:hypothetical protein
VRWGTGDERRGEGNEDNWENEKLKIGKDGYSKNN